MREIIKKYFLIVSSSLGRNIVPAQDIRAEPFRSEVRKTRNCLFLNAFLYLYIISLEKHPQTKQTNKKDFMHYLLALFAALQDYDYEKKKLLATRGGHIGMFSILLLALFWLQEPFELI